MQTNSTGVLRDESTLLQRIINTFNAVMLHRQQKAAIINTRDNCHVIKINTSTLQTIFLDDICKYLTTQGKFDTKT